MRKLSLCPSVRLSNACIVTKQKKRSVQIFTALHGIQTRSSDENSVCPSVRLSVRLSVCLSVKRVNCG